MERHMGKRKQSAQSTVELIGGIVVLIPLIFCVIDLAIIVMAGFKNDSICREVCRAAASVDPNDCTRIANIEISKYNKPGDFARYSLSANPQVSDLERPASEHGLVRGTVSVKTSAAVHAPFIIGFFVPNCKLDASQSFPITYNMP